MCLFFILFHQTFKAFIPIFSSVFTAFSAHISKNQAYFYLLYIFKYHFSITPHHYAYPNISLILAFSAST
nr:MAG TPA: hypothetical protein [Caudoviricetes sp.]